MKQTYKSDELVAMRVKPPANEFDFGSPDVELVDLGKERKVTHRGFKAVVVALLVWIALVCSWPMFRDLYLYWKFTQAMEGLRQGIEEERGKK